jgi:hypothetical protein
LRLGGLAALRLKEAPEFLEIEAPSFKRKAAKPPRRKEQAIWEKPFS